MCFAAAGILMLPVTFMGQGVDAAGPQKVELLWPGGAPGALGNAEEDRPMLTVFLPEWAKAAGFGVVVCPGGGYHNLAMDHEGKQVAEWLNGLGAAAFVLKYRLGPRYHHPVEMDDGLRAMRFVRLHAPDYGITPDRIGIWGFSAGGHLASTVGTHFDGGNPNASDPIDRIGSRPDFMVLAYPVISFTTPYVHKGSMLNLLGENPDPQLVRLLSNELQVTPETPPTFLFHTTADDGVPIENSVLFYEALRESHVPAEMHIFEQGKHGVGLAKSDPALSHWPELLALWFRTRGLLK
ncbi:MAG TPA: alpha/beta hydrolase [Terriglobia bacterium]|nr:alpha/beta hydrolase [Terriglobia bacterium]